MGWGIEEIQGARTVQRHTQNMGISKTQSPPVNWIPPLPQARDWQGSHHSLLHLKQFCQTKTPEAGGPLSLFRCQTILGKRVGVALVTNPIGRLPTRSDRGDTPVDSTAFPSRVKRYVRKLLVPCSDITRPRFTNYREMMLRQKQF